MSKEFGERLKELRREKGLLQNELGEIVGVTDSAVGGWESGVREPRYEILIALADCFHVSLDYLMGRTDERLYKST